MNRLALSLSLLAPASLALTACDTAGERADTGKCPVGEVCSPKTPNGLQFIGSPLSDQLFGGGPHATAVGGTQAIDLKVDLGATFGALTLPYAADNDGGTGISVVSTAAATVTVRGERDRANYLRITDPVTGELFDRYQLTGSTITSLELVPTRLEVIPSDRQIVWAVGKRTIGVALTGQVQAGSGPTATRVVDTSMKLEAAGAVRRAWDTVDLTATSAGEVGLAVTAGNRPTTTFPVTFVAGADVLAPIDALVIPADGSFPLCFEALSGARFISGLDWAFVVDGVAQTPSVFAPNCATVSSTGRTSGSIAVRASAGGRELAVTVTIGTARTAPSRARAPITAPMSAGDRAAM